MNELLAHPIIVGVVLTVVNILLFPTVGAWIRSSVAFQVIERLRPLTERMEVVSDILSKVEAEQRRQNQEMLDHKVYANREFEFIRGDIKALTNIVATKGKGDV